MFSRQASEYSFVYFYLIWSLPKAQDRFIWGNDLCVVLQTGQVNIEAVNWYIPENHSYITGLEIFMGLGPSWDWWIWLWTHFNKEEALLNTGQDMDTGQVLTGDSFMLRVPPWLTLVRGLERQKSQGLGTSSLCVIKHISCALGDNPTCLQKQKYMVVIWNEQQPPAFQEVNCPCGSGVYGLKVILFNRSLMLSNLYLKHNVSHHKINKIYKEVPTNHLEQFTVPTVNSSPTCCIIQFLITLSTPVKGGRVPLRDV